MEADAHKLWDIIQILKEQELEIRELLSSENASDAVRGLSGALVTVTNAFSKKAVDLVAVLENNKQRLREIDDKYKEVSRLERDASDTLAKAANIDLSKIHDIQKTHELLGASNAECTQLKTDLNRARDRIGILEAEKVALTNEKQALLAELDHIRDNAREQVERLEAEKAALAERHTEELRQQIEAARFETEAAVQTDLVRLKDENATLEKAKLRAEGQITELRQRADDTRSESNSAAQAQINQLTDRLRDLELTFSLLSTDRDTARGENTELRQQAQGLRRQAEGLQRVRDSLQYELSQAKESSALMEKVLQHAQEDLESARGDTERWKTYYDREVDRGRQALVTHLSADVENILKFHTDRIQDKIWEQQREQYQEIYKTLQRIQRMDNRFDEEGTRIERQIDALRTSIGEALLGLSNGVTEDLLILSNSITDEFNQQNDAQHGFATQLQEMITRRLQQPQPQPQQGQSRADTSAQQKDDTPSPRPYGVSRSPELGDLRRTSPDPGDNSSSGGLIPLDQLRGQTLGADASTGLHRRPSTSESSKQFLEEKSKRLRVEPMEPIRSPTASTAGEGYRTEIETPQPVQREAFTRAPVPTQLRVSAQAPHPASIPPRTSSRSMIPRPTTISPTPPSSPYGPPFPGQGISGRGGLSQRSLAPQTTHPSGVPQMKTLSSEPSSSAIRSGTSTSTLAPQTTAHGGIVGRALDKLKSKASLHKLTGEDRKRRKSVVGAGVGAAGPSSAAGGSMSMVATGHVGQAGPTSSVSGQHAPAPAPAPQPQLPPVRIDVSSAHRIENSILFAQAQKTFREDGDFRARKRNFEHNQSQRRDCWWGSHIRKHEIHWTDQSGPCDECRNAKKKRTQCMIMIKPTVALLLNPQPGDAASQEAFDQSNEAREEEEGE